MNSPSRDRYLINSVLRACKILKSFSGDRAHFKISDLAHQLHLDRSTTYRVPPLPGTGWFCREK